MSERPGSSAGGSDPAQRRRSSFVEFFNSRSASNPQTSSSPPSTTAPTAIPKQPHSRSLSIALGLSSSSPAQSTPYNAFARQRRSSISTSGTGSPEFRNSFGDEPAVIEEDDTMKASANPPASPPPSPSFGRRLSFGAQALRDVRQGGNNAGAPSGGRQPSSSLYTVGENQENNAPTTATTTGKSRGLSSPLISCSSAPTPCPLVESKQTLTSPLGEGFNWSESLRDRTKRSPSFSGSNAFAARTRAPSNPAPEPPKEIPKPVPTPTKMKKPDHLGERMLRGDFMMD